jgi:hypothetical protein
MMAKRLGVSKRMRALLALAPICFLGAMVASPVAARENYALIAAVSEYPNLAEKYWLKGPVNDAVLVRDYLLTSAPVKFEADNITTLGSGEGLELATHDSILRELGEIAAKAQKGDFVFLQFSGHGSYQPATEADATEQDGRDEIFLAADTKMADGGKFMPNVITDNQFAEAFTAIRKTGATLWLVFDSCHSGTITRGAPGEDDLVMREIKPGDMGIPESAFADVETVGTDDGEATRAAPLSAATYEEDAELGNMVAFFAAQSTETTPEKGYEVTLEDGTTIKQNYGVFTHTIFSAMAKNPAMTYRQLAQSVLSSYAAGNMLKPTPLFEGSLDMPIFGNDEVADVAQWPTVVGADKGLTISAGQLHGLARGTKLLVLPSPAASDEEALGVLEVASNDQLRSKLVPAADASGKTLAVADVPVGAYVRLVETAYAFELVVAKPDPATADAAEVAAIEEALDAILADSDRPLAMRVVEAGEPADVRLALYTEREVFDMELEADRAAGALVAVDRDIDPTDLDESTPLLWLLPPTGDISLKPQKRSAAMDLGETETGDFTSNLSENLVTIFRATSLSRLSQVSTFKPKDFTLSFGVQSAGGETIAALEPEKTPIVRPGDRLYVDMTNKSGKAVDLNVLYVDHDYGITLLCTAHLANNDRLFQPIADLNETDRASERIVAVVNESGKDLTDLSFLEQRGVVVRTRGPEDTSLIGMLADLGAGAPTRGPTAAAQRDTKQPRGAVVMVPLEVVSPTGETPAAEIAPVDERTPVGSC